MDEIKRLEREINALQRELQRQNNETVGARQRLVDENRRALQAYKVEMSSSLKSHDKQTQLEYERLLAQYVSSVNQELQLESAKMDVNYQKLLADVRKNEEQLVEKNRQLEGLIQSLRTDISKRNEGSSIEAKKYLNEAVIEFEHLKKKPHQKFLPNKLRLHYENVRSAIEMLKSGLFEATIAIAISSRSGLERMSYDLDDKINEWNRYYDLFEEKLHYLDEKFQQTVEEWCTHTEQNANFKGDEQRLRIFEVNFWSKGQYLKLLEPVDEMRVICKKIQELGRENYLMQHEGETEYSIKQKIEQIDLTQKQLIDCSAYLKSVYDAACERSVWGEKIIDFLTNELNIVWIGEKSNFRKVTAEVYEKADYVDYAKQFPDKISQPQDTREWLELVFETALGAIIYLYILPVELNNSVSNQIMIHIDFVGPEQNDFTRDLYLHIHECVGIEDTTSGIVNYTSDVNQLKASSIRVFRETATSIENKKRIL